jgi:methylenetetrahydrofolate dehydrogenase (NADP+)/methenyltetrahydrofolate cyclohydrolase
MAATIIDGVSFGNRIREEIALAVANLGREGHRVQLNAVMVGSSPAGEVYARRQGEACRAVGIGYELVTLPADATAARVRREIAQLNENNSVTGIMLHLPLPAHLDATALQYQIDPVKDVEGVNPANIGYVVYGHTLIAPCTALAVIEMIKSTGVTLRGAEAVVVGASEIAGKPIALLLAEEMATVTLCHIATVDLAAHTRRAEVLVVAVGKVGLIQGEQVRPGACVIDVGINRVRGVDGTMRTVGDVDYESVFPVAGHLSPVPGGVGPVTVAMLLKNTFRSAMLGLKGSRV